MNKKTLVILITIVAIFLVAGGVLALTSKQTDISSEDRSETIPINTQANVPPQSNDAISTQGSYVSLTDYSKDPSKYADSKIVYFFHASWCPICQGIDKEINADLSRVPAGVTIIKTDFDSSVDLRKKYGVTYQYTFVQVDASGNEIAQWSANTLAKALSGIKS